MVSKRSARVLTFSLAGISIVALGIGATTAVSALTRREKAEKLAELTNRPVEEVIEEKYTSNKTYGEIAEENGVLDEFQEQNPNCDGTSNGTHSNNHDNSTHNHQRGNGQGQGHGYGYGRHHRQ